MLLPWSDHGLLKIRPDLQFPPAKISRPTFLRHALIASALTAVIVVYFTLSEMAVRLGQYAVAFCAFARFERIFCAFARFEGLLCSIFMLLAHMRSFTALQFTDICYRSSYGAAKFQLWSAIDKCCVMGYKCCVVGCKSGYNSEKSNGIPVISRLAADHTTLISHNAALINCKPQLKLSSTVARLVTDICELQSCEQMQLAYQQKNWA